MTDNLFKEHSIQAIEACVAKALSELLGQKISVGIGRLEVSSDVLGMSHSASFSVSAQQESPLGSEPSPF